MWNDPNLIRTIKQGGVAVMPTDTLYGIVGDALNMSAVNRIYSLRKRSPQKPCIILIGSMDELEKFSIILTEEQKKTVAQYWPGPVSIICDCDNEELAYLHRGTNSLAMRLPENQSLRSLLLETGPLVAPSANTEGQPPAKNIAEAKKYFGDGVDMYVDAGNREGKPSKIIRLEKDGTESVVRA